MPREFLSFLFMDITWHGGTYCTIKAKQALAVVNPPAKTDPTSLKADMLIVTTSEQGAETELNKAGSEKPRRIDWSGEYEVSGAVLTLQQLAQGSYFTFGADNLRLCYVENIGKQLNDEDLEAIGDVDILILPITETMNAETAHKVVEAIEPRCVIPLAAETPALVESFLKLAGATNTEAQDKYSIAGRSSLREDQTEYILLKKQS